MVNVMGFHLILGLLVLHLFADVVYILAGGFSGDSNKQSSEVISLQEQLAELKKANNLK